MPKRFIEFYIVDVLLSLEKINRFTSNIKYADEFPDNELVFSATIRELSVLGESIKQVLHHQPFAETVKPEWRIIVSLRNFVVHEYFGINEYEIFRVVKKDIVEFEKEFMNFLKSIKNETNILETLTSSAKKLGQQGYADADRYLQKTITNISS